MKKLVLAVAALSVSNLANAVPLFSDNFSGNLSKWATNPASEADFAIIGGELRQSNTTPDIPYNDLYIPSGFNWSDYEVSLKVRHVEGFYSVTALGITVRRQPDMSDATESTDPAGYFIQLHGGGMVQLIKQDGFGGSEILQDSGEGSLPVPNEQGYLVKVRAVGDWLQVFVNGIKYIDVQDATYKTGTVSLESVHVVGGFDDVVINPIFAIKDSVTWANPPYSVKCVNNTTRKTVSVNKNVTESYNCEKAGLIVNGGDDVSVTIRGKKKK